MYEFSYLRYKHYCFFTAVINLLGYNIDFLDYMSRVYICNISTFTDTFLPISVFTHDLADLRHYNSHGEVLYIYLYTSLS